MSNCNNCFNGCSETISDQCIRYTGIDVPELGISNGDPLSVIEQALTTFLVSALNGSGIKIDLSSIDVCTLVQQYLPTCGEMSIADISKALIQASCDLQEKVDVIDATLAVLNADYTIGCLTGVTSSSDTHAIVQAIITKLCSVSDDVDSLAAQLPLYVQQSEICTLVEECVNNNSGTSLASSKMLPYSPIPYYGAISNYPATGDSFDATGAGLGYWARVYMCNGDNGTPDLRGRVAVGATNTPSTNSFSAETNPGANGNPIYDKGDAKGNNTVVLSLGQMPGHNHTNSTAITTISPATHSHFTVGLSQGNTLTSTNTISQGFSDGGNLGYSLRGYNGAATIGKSSDVALSATTTLTILSQGQNEAHQNYQPGLAVYYIMYIPA